MKNPLLTKRENEIVDFGCPVCGAVYNIIISDKEGVLFQCSNEKCKSGNPRITLANASKKCPRSAEVIEDVCDLRQKDKEIANIKRSIECTQSCIDNIKNGSGSEQDRMLRLKAAYKTVRDLKLFDKNGNRIYDKHNPFIAKFPKFNDVDMAFVYNIRTKRKVKTMLLAAWWCAKYNYSCSMESLADNRKSIRSDRRKLRSLLTDRFHIVKELKNKKVKLEYI